MLSGSSNQAFLPGQAGYLEVLAEMKNQSIAERRQSIAILFAQTLLHSTKWVAIGPSPRELEIIKERSYAIADSMMDAPPLRNEQ